MIIAILAYDGIYGGLHGMNNHRIIECETIEEAIYFARSDSAEVMYDYDVVEEFETDAEEEGIERDSEEWEDYIEERIQENIDYELYEVVKDIYPIDEMELDFFNDDETFIKEHCRELNY